MAGLTCLEAVSLAFLMTVLFADTDGSVINRRSDYSMYDYNFNRVGDTTLDNEVTDCGLVKHQYQKGYIRLREYLERIQGCGREGKLKNMNGIAKSTMDDLEEKEIKGIAAAATEDFDDSDDLDQDNTISTVVSSPSQHSQPISGPHGSVQLTSQSQQGQGLLYKGSPAAPAPAKPMQYNSFAHLIEYNKPATQAPVASTYNVPQHLVKNSRPQNFMSRIQTFYSADRATENSAPRRKFYSSGQNSVNSFPVAVGRPLVQPAMASASMNTIDQPRLGATPHRYFTQNNKQTQQAKANQNTYMPTSEKSSTMSFDKNSYSETDSQNKDESNKIENYAAPSENKQLSKTLASLDSPTSIDDEPTDDTQTSANKNMNPTNKITGITTLSSKDSPPTSTSPGSSSSEDFVAENIDSPTSENSPSAEDQLDPVESTPSDGTDPQMNDKPANPKNLEINLDVLKHKIMHSTNATFLRRMLTLIRKITHHKDFKKLDTKGQNIVMKANSAVSAINNAYQQEQRARVQMSPPRNPRPMPPVMDTDLMDDDVITKKFQIERKPIQYQPQPLYNNPYYNLQRWQYGLYNGNALD